MAHAHGRKVDPRAILNLATGQARPELEAAISANLRISTRHARRYIAALAWGGYLELRPVASSRSMSVHVTARGQKTLVRARRLLEQTLGRTDCSRYSKSTPRPCATDPTANHRVSLGKRSGFLPSRSAHPASVAPSMDQPGCRFRIPRKHACSHGPSEGGVGFRVDQNCRNCSLRGYPGLYRNFSPRICGWCQRETIVAPGWEKGHRPVQASDRTLGEHGMAPRAMIARSRDQ